MKIDYGSSMSIKTTRYSNTISADILFECDMKTTTIQKAFLGTSKSKSRLIKKLAAELQCACVLVTLHCLDGADFSTDRESSSLSSVLTPIPW